MRLPFRPPLALDDLIAFFGLRAIPGVEEVVDGRYIRSVRVPGGVAIVSVTTDGDGDAGNDGRRGGGHDVRDGDGPALVARVRVDSAGDLGHAVAACRRALDLDADPTTIDAALGADPLLAPLVAGAPGRRAPGHVDAAELAVRAVLGQQVSLLAARRLAGRLAELCGDPLPEPVANLTTAFPTPAAIADADLDRIGMPGARRETLRTLARGLADGDIRLTSDVDPDEAERRLLEIRGIGPWTAAYIRMRGLGDRDVLLATDLGVRHALARLGVDQPAAIAGLARRWSPWGSYAVQHLWASLGAP